MKAYSAGGLTDYEEKATIAVPKLVRELAYQ
jgi:hypothetical protein